MDGRMDRNWVHSSLMLLHNLNPEKWRLALGNAVTLISEDDGVWKNVFNMKVFSRWSS